METVNSASLKQLLQSQQNEFEMNYNFVSVRCIELHTVNQSTDCSAY